MNQEKTGALIAACRRAQGLTQAQLAERLHITDRAVSKWETGKSLPDASLMLALCGILGVTADELLLGVCRENAEEPAVPPAVFPCRRPKSLERRNPLAAILFTGILALGGGICLLCDAILNGKMTWSAIVLSSLALAWAVCLPGLLWRRLRRCLLALSVCLLPYLFLLSVLLHRPKVFSTGAAAAVPSLGFLWLACAILVRQESGRRAAGICFLLCIPFQLLLNLTLLWTLGDPLWDIWDLLSALLLLACAAGTFFWDWVRRRQTTKNSP